jgi:hypothetical protein
MAEEVEEARDWEAGRSLDVLCSGREARTRRMDWLGGAQSPWAWAEVPFRAPETLAGWATVVGEDSARVFARVKPQRLQKGPDRGLFGGGMQRAHQCYLRK